MVYNEVQNKANRTFERTLTYDLYTDPNVYKQELEDVFAKSWQLVGHVSQLEKTGQFFTAEVAGEPILVTRANDGVIRAY